MKKNGFTLVELLAVIAILAIILVIAYPLITGVIESSRKKTLVASAQMVVKASDLAFANGEIAASGTHSCLVAAPDFAVEANNDPWGTAITDCSVVLDATGGVSTVSYGTSTSPWYLLLVDPADLDASSTGIFTAGS